MEKLLKLEDIVLQPSQLNAGNQESKFNFGITDPSDNTTSLPIFTAPMPSVISKENWRVWNKAGIKPVLPRTEALEHRLDGCQYIFTAFSLSEIRENFLARGKRQSRNQFKICIDNGNGHDTEVLNVATELRNLYGQQVNIMAGNIGNAKTYIDYCKAEIDYVRVGIGTGSAVEVDRFGFETPIISLLLDITGVKLTSCTGLKKTKIIADGGIFTAADILKCIAVGADYVMCGRTFVRLIESAGEVFSKDKDKGLDPVSPDIINGCKNIKDLRELNLVRRFAGVSTYDEINPSGDYDIIHDWIGSGDLMDGTSELIRVNSTLDIWLKEMYTVFKMGFKMSGACTWKEYKENIKFGIV